MRLEALLRRRIGVAQLVDELRAALDRKIGEGVAERVEEPAELGDLVRHHDHRDQLLDLRGDLQRYRGP